jgi:protein-tyrosine phosphatase
MAEFIMKKISKNYDFHIESKAVSREEIGNSIYPDAAKTLRDKNVPFGNHRARQITKEDYEEFDYIIIMEEYNMPRLLRIIDNDNKHKVYRLLDFTSTPGDIEDPWYSGDFEKVYNQIYHGCECLLKHIKTKDI